MCFSLSLTGHHTIAGLGHQYSVYNPMTRHPSLDRLLSHTANIILIWESYQSCQYCINIYTHLYLYIQKWCFDCSGVIGALSFMAYYDFLYGWYVILDMHFWAIIVMSNNSEKKTKMSVRILFLCEIVKSEKDNICQLFFISIPWWGQFSWKIKKCDDLIFH